MQGMVLDVVTSMNSAAYTEYRDINSIIAQVHFGDEITFKFDFNICSNVLSVLYGGLSSYNNIGANLINK